MTADLKPGRHGRRLIPEALYSSRVAEDHRFREARQETALGHIPEGRNIQDPDIRWETLAKRIEKIPGWREKSLRLLQEVLHKK
jgi:hypothetical protein